MQEDRMIMCKFRKNGAPNPHPRTHRSTGICNLLHINMQKAKKCMDQEGE